MSKTYEKVLLLGNLRQHEIALPPDGMKLSDLLVRLGEWPKPTQRVVALNRYFEFAPFREIDLQAQVYNSHSIQFERIK